MNEAVPHGCCPCCGSSSFRIFYDLDRVPVNSVLLLNSRETALTFPTGRLSLAFCQACGFIWNHSFDPSLVEYSSRYEETQGFSPAFREWHCGLAQRLVDRHNLRNKKILEIGCGKGEFLDLLCQFGYNRGLGFDPSYVPGRVAESNNSLVEFICDNYSDKYSGHGADFVCCKMTLEHICDARGFIQTVRRSLRGAPNTLVFFQVPDALRILRDIAFWDVYYEHCSYYSIGSLSRLFRREGFAITAISREYDDQYLTLEARPTDDSVERRSPEEDDLDEMNELALRFAEGAHAQINGWKSRLETYRREGRRIVIWGSGSKGVSFLTVLGDLNSAIEYVVDINPNRHGNYMAGTGQEIVGPEFLKNHKPDVVIVMNPVYRNEIASELRAQMVAAEVITT